MMNRITIIVLLCALSGIKLQADPVPDRKLPSGMQVPVSEISLEVRTGSEDYLMPTLEELLGGPVDDFGDVRDTEMLKLDLVDYAKKYLGCRYVHGGKGPKVFDCSGYTSFIFRNFGYSISPGSRLQGAQGKRVSLDSVEVGDLMFFSGRAGGKTVGHVGMVIEVNEATGQLKFIHASTKKGITIQSFPDGAYYSKHFLHVQRVIDDEKLMAGGK